MEPIQRLYTILEEKGGKIANLSNKIMQEGIESTTLQETVKFVCEHRHDVIRPTLVRESCGAVGGNPEDVENVSVAMVLKCYELGILDDMVDTEDFIRFHPTLSGRYGRDLTLITSIIINAKSYLMLGSASKRLDRQKFEQVNQAFYSFILKMIEAEAMNTEIKKRKIEGIKN